ncbi:5-oxoprolinase, partial [Passer montanus]|uniref:5-oxoprolinase n=1 Tax=Passer montanus TaxID=9160 RepID=UPI001960FF43
CPRRHSGLLSALGLALADAVQEEQEPCALPYGPAAFPRLEARLRELERRCRDALGAQGFAPEQIRTEPFLHLRYEGTDCALMVSAQGHPARPGTCAAGDFLAAFTDRYQQEFGFTIPGRAVLVCPMSPIRNLGPELREGDVILSNHPRAGGSHLPDLTVITPVFWPGEPRPVFFVASRGHHADVGGCSPGSMPPHSQSLAQEGAAFVSFKLVTNEQMGRTLQRTARTGIGVVPGCRGPAEQMGRTLQRTAISTNIKERLDFSCALFGPDGGLVSNAPHIPVHLGAMQEAVQFQIRNLGPELREGDVILSNHPRAGGSHLPDLTVITPVFWPGEPRPVFFVASRGHHADVGGCSPGSMPPHSQSLAQEGAAFVSFKLVTNGEFQEQAVPEALLAPGAVPGCSGSRNLRDNLADLRAQVAANQKGIGLVRELIGEHGLATVQAYMGHVQANAEVAVRDTLRAVAARWGTALAAEDTMDDGTPIRLRVALRPREGSAVFDFGGTGPQVLGNCNAPRAITLSALIYCLRCLVGHDIPLNQGCLAPVQVRIPPGSILDPSPDAAVVGGNVLTSQRVVDVVLRAFGACAASQVSGTDRFGGGLSGVFLGFSGIFLGSLTPVSPPRYPVLLRRFELRAGSGGAGRHRGGDGVVRELQFRARSELSVLSERRATRPYGMAGEGPPKISPKYPQNIPQNTP